MRKYITIIIGIVLVAASAYIARDLANKDKKQAPKKEKVKPTVFAETIQNANLPVVVYESGRLTAKNKIEIYAEVQGVMEFGEKEFKPGARFSKGESIVRIKNDDYVANLQAQKSNLQNLITAILPDLKLDYPQSYQKWDSYLKNFDVHKSIAPLPEVSSDKEKYFVTGRNIYTSYYTTKNMEIIYEKYKLKAPFNGIVTEALVTAGSLVRPGQKLGEFIDPGVYEMEVSVNKSILSALSVGKKVTVRDPENYRQQWEGKIIRINGKVDRSTQTVKVYVELRDQELKDGMYLEAIMNGEPIESAVELSRGLLVDESKVYIVQDGALQLVQIEPVFFNRKTVIVQGLTDGQVLVTKPVSGAYSGMKVIIYQSPLK